MRDLSKYETDYSNQPFDRLHLNFRRTKLIEQIKKYPHQSILEISCGLHPFFEIFSDFDKLVIVEPTPGFYKNALSSLKKNPHINSKVSVINTFLENAIESLKNQSFDFIILSNVLQEIENLDTFLTGLNQICTPETILHIVVPNANSFHRLLAYEMGIIDSPRQLSDRNFLLQQQRVFDLELLSKLLKEYDFNIVDSGTTFIKPFTHQQMQDLIDNKIIDDKILQGLYKMTKHMPQLGAEIFVNCKISK